MSKPMIKILVAAFAAGLFVTPVVHAEYRTIAVEVFKAKGNTVNVNVHSDVESERKKNIPVKAATTILKKAQGWGSGVGVAIVSDRVDLSSFLSLMDAVSKNPWLELELLRGKRSGMGEHILRHYKIDAKRRVGAPDDSDNGDSKEGEEASVFGADVQRTAVAEMLKRLPDLAIISCWAPSLRHDKALATLSVVKHVSAEKEAVDALIKMHDDRKRGMASILALASFGDDPRVKPALLELVKHAKSHIRTVAIDALGQENFQSDETVAALTGALDDDASIVVTHAAMSLGHHGSKAASAVPQLFRVLDNREGYAAWQAATALGRIGPQAKEALPNLRRLAASDSTLEADASKEAIQQITGVED